MHFAIKDYVFDVAHLKVEQLVFVMIQVLYRTAAREGWLKDEDLSAAARGLLKEWIDELDRQAGNTGWWTTWAKRFKSEAKLSLVFGPLGLELTGLSAQEFEPFTRAMRPRLERFLRDLLNPLLELLQGGAEKPSILLVDDIDKLGKGLPDQQPVLDDLFVNNLRYLLDVGSAAIYTIPMSLRFSEYFTRVVSEAHLVVLPNVPLYQRGRPERDQVGWDFLKRLIDQRIEPDLRTEQAVEKIIELSGGVPRELCRLVREGFLQVHSRRGERLELVDVENAISKLARDYATSHGPDAVAHLKESLELPLGMRPRREALYLFDSLALLGCEDGEPWYDVHPLAARALHLKSLSGGRP